MKTVTISHFNIHNLIIFAVLRRTHCSLRRSFKFQVASEAMHERTREWPREWAAKPPRTLLSRLLSCTARAWLPRYRPCGDLAPRLHSLTLSYPPEVMSRLISALKWSTRCQMGLRVHKKRMYYIDNLPYVHIKSLRTSIHYMNFFYDGRCRRVGYNPTTIKHGKASLFNFRQRTIKTCSVQ